MKARARRVSFVLFAAALVLGTGWFAWPAYEADPRMREATAPAAAAPPNGVAGAVPPADAAARGEAVARVPVVPDPAAAADGVGLAMATAPGVFGRLLQNGAPLRDVGVQARQMCQDMAVGAEGRTDGDGRFVLPLPQGHYALALRGAGVPHGQSWRDIAISSGQRLDLGDLEVPLGAAITGSVVDEREQPIAGALVFVTGNGFPAIDAAVADVTAMPGIVFTRTDAAGRFRVDDVRPGDCQVRVEYRDLHFGWRDAKATAGATVDCGVFVGGGRPTVHGRVVDVAGAPVAGARVVPGGASDGSDLQVRRAVHTDARGLFTLPVGIEDDLTVFADGCEPLPARASTEAPGPVQFVVQPANVLHGRVVGADRAGALRVSTLDDDYWRGAAWVKDMIYRDHPIAADGTFRVAAVPKGRWQVTATIPGVGTVEPFVVDVPLTAPLELALRKTIAVAVRVVDDLGAPVSGASVVRIQPDEIPAPNQYNGPATWFTWGDRVDATTAANGEVVMRMPPGKPLLVAARSPRHLAAGTTAPAGAVPANVTLVVPRGATIEGRIDDGGLGAHVRFHVSCTAPVGSGEEPHLGGAAVGRDGRFVVSALPPQRVRIRLAAGDDTSGSGSGGRLPHALPLLGSFEPLAAPIELDLRAGETHAVHLPTPRLGTISGRVTLAGVPQANALVYGRGTVKRPFDFDEPTRNDDVHTFHPHVRTDAEGRFRFLVARAERWQLSARAAGSRHWTPALDVDCATATANVHVDIALPGGSIRGSYDLTGVPAQQRERFEAQVYPLAEAHLDAFHHRDYTMSLSWCAPKQELARDGSFAFAGVPAGAWVLRIVQGSWLGTTVWQRAVRIVGDEAHDLGRIEPPARHAIRVRTGADADIGLWLMEPVEGNEHGLFVWTIGIPSNGGFELGHLAPGRYRLRPFHREPGFAGDWGVSGQPVGTPAEIEVHTDGRVTPDVVWPDGVK